MDKSNFKDFKIVESIFEYRFYPIVNIHRLVDDFETGLKSIFENKATETMVPNNAPPNIPRFVLSSKNKRVLEIGPVSAIYKSHPEDLANDKAIGLYQNKANKIYQFLKSKKEIKIESFATSNVIHYPLKDIKYPIENEILQEFFKIEQPGDFKAVSFTIVRKSGNHVFTNSIDAYEKRDVKIQHKSSDQDIQLIRLPISGFPIIEKGVINNIIIKQDTESQEGNADSSKQFAEILSMTIEKINKHADEFIFMRK